MPSDRPLLRLLTLMRVEAFFHTQAKEPHEICRIREGNQRIGEQKIDFAAGMIVADPERSKGLSVLQQF